MGILNPLEIDAAGGALNQGVFNLNAQSLAKWIKARNSAAAGISKARIVCVGNSKMAGVNATSLRTQSVPAFIAKAMVAAGLPSFAQNVAGSSETTITIPQYMSRDGNVTFGTGWVISTAKSFGGYAFLAPSSGNVTTPATYSAPILCDKLLVGYCQSSTTGSFVYSINGGADSAPIATVGAGGGFAFLTIDLPRQVGNTIAFKRVSGTGDFFLDFLMPYDSQVPSIEVVNAGWGASTSSDWAETTNGGRNEINVLKSLQPNLTIIKGPTNDYTPSYGPIPLETFASNIQALVTAAKISGDALLIAEASSSPLRQSQEIQDQYNAVLRSLAASNNLPFFDGVGRIGGYDAANALGYYSDQTHLTAPGYAFEGMWIGAALARV